MRTLTVGESTPEPMLEEAVRALECGDARVVLERVAVLTRRGPVIECRALEGAAAPLCAEERRVQRENAARALEASRLGRRLRGLPLDWDDTPA